MWFFQEGFTYRNFLLDALTIFFLIVWFWLLITVASDLFRRQDISGWVKAMWVIGWIVFPYIVVLAYLIFQGRGMAERNVQQARQARDELGSAVGFSAADEIEKLGRLKQARSDQPRRICTTARSARLGNADYPGGARPGCKRARPASMSGPDMLLCFRPRSVTAATALHAPNAARLLNETKGSGSNSSRLGPSALI